MPNGIAATHGVVGFDDIGASDQVGASATHTAPNAMRSAIHGINAKPAVGARDRAKAAPKNWMSGASRKISPRQRRSAVGNGR